MKKAIVFLNLLLLSVGTGIACYGKAVNENTAKTTGSNFLLSNGIPGVQSSADLAIAYTATAQVNGKAIVDYYVFNFTGGNGFVMVSGDDNIRPILAYSFQSSFDLNHMAPATKDWIEGYQNQITYTLTNSLPAKDGTIEQWNDLKQVKKVNVAARTTSVFPSSTVWLCSTTWDQEPGYNNYCPTGSGGRAVTGCVATAMAQVMKFWNWPSVGTGAHTYTLNPNPNGYPAQTADFGNTVYNWTEMSAHLTNSCTATDTLMHHAGISVEMNYDPSESGADVTESQTTGPNCAEYALKTYFHYVPTLHGEIRDGVSPGFGGGFLPPTQTAFTTTAWVSLLEAELNAGRPMLYMGQEATGGGHCWVLDGYESSNMMHFNWGWSGASDGYYTVDNLAPPALGTGAGSGNFNLDQGVVLGIQPDSFPSNPGNITMASQLDIPASSAIPYGTAFSAVVKITNSGTTAFTGSIEADVFDTSNNFKCTIQTLSGQTIAASSTSATLTFSTTGILALIPGQYIIRIRYQASSSSTWTYVANNGNYVNYNYVDIRNNGTVAGMELFSPINVTTGYTMAIGGALTLNTSIVYYSSVTTSSFSGSLQAVMTNVSTGTVYPVQLYTSQVISANTIPPVTFSISHLTVPAGIYALAIQYQTGGTGAFDYIGSDYYENPVLITVNHGVGVNTPSSVADDIAVYPNPANDMINIAAQGTVIDLLTINDMQGREIFKMKPDNSQTVISIPVGSYAAGMYLVQMQTATGVVTKKIVVTK